MIHANTPLTEFVEWLRDKLIAEGQPSVVIGYVDQLYDLAAKSEK